MDKDIAHTITPYYYSFEGPEEEFLAVLVPKISFTSANQLIIVNFIGLVNCITDYITLEDVEFTPTKYVVHCRI